MVLLSALLTGRHNRHLPNPVYVCEHTDKDSMALANMMRKPSYVTVKDVVSTIFVPGTQEDKLHL